MVQRDQLDTYWGRKILFFLIRAIDDDATMAAAPVESCQSVTLRSPWGRIGSVLYTKKRLHRTRRRFQHISANSLSSAAHKPPITWQWLQELSEASKNRRMRRRRLLDPRPIPEGVQEPICPRKKCVIWARWRPVPVKYAITRGPPVVAVAVSLDPVLPQR